MRHTYWIAALAILLLNGNTLANEHEMGKGHKFEPAKTRQEAIARTKEKLAKLEAMSDEEWGKKRTEMKKRHEERKAKHQARKEKSEGKREEAPAAGGAAVTTTPSLPDVVEKK